MAKKELKLTPAKQWRKTELVELPSGFVAELQRMNVLTMLQRGGDDAPNFLKNQVAQSLQQNGSKKTAESITFELSDPAEVVETIHFFAKAAFVTPRLVDEITDEEDAVFVGHLSEQDLAFVMAYALGDRVSVDALSEFHHQAEADVEPVPAE